MSSTSNASTPSLTAASGISSRSPTPEPILDILATHGYSGNGRALLRYEGEVPLMDVSVYPWVLGSTELMPNYLEEEDINGTPTSPSSPRPEWKLERRSPTPEPWLDTVARNAPNGWGNDAVFHNHFPTE